MNKHHLLILSSFAAIMLSCSEGNDDSVTKPDDEINTNKIGLKYEEQWNLIDGDLSDKNCNGIDSISNEKSYISIWTVMRKDFSAFFSFAWKTQDTLTIILSPNFSDTSNHNTADALKMRIRFSIDQLPTNIRYFKITRHPLAFKVNASDSVKGYIDLTKDYTSPKTNCRE